MARPLRIEIKDGWYHVTARGNNRQAIYMDGRDRLHFLELLGEMTGRYGLEVHAYVLMANHYHLLVRTPQANLSAAMKWLNVAYSIWWNRRHGRTGHVLQGRFKAVVVQSGGWVLECSLYIHLNPVAVQALGLSKRQKQAQGRGFVQASGEVRAARLERLRAYGWSSFGAYAGYSGAAPWLQTGELLKRAGGQEGYRQMAEARVAQGLEESLWSRLKWGLVLGEERFAEGVRKQLKAGRESSGRRWVRERWSWGEIVKAVEEERGQKWADFAGRYGDSGRALALYVARRHSGLTLKGLGEAVGGMDYTAVAMAIRRFERALKQEGALRKVVERVLKRLE